MKPRCATKGSPKHNRRERLFNTVTKVVTENAGDTRGQSSRSHMTRGGATWKILAPSPRWRPVVTLRSRPFPRHSSPASSDGSRHGRFVLERRARRREDLLAGGPRGRGAPARCSCGRTASTSTSGGSNGCTPASPRRASRRTRGTTSGTDEASPRAAGRGTSSRAASTPSSRTPCSTRGASARRTERAVVRGPPSSFRSHHFFFPLPKRTTQLCRRAPHARTPRTLSLATLRPVPSESSSHRQTSPPPVPSHHLSSTTHSSVRALYPPSVPLFLGGVSFGGLVATTAALRVLATNELRVAGVVLVAPALDLEWTPVLRFQAGIGAFLARRAPNVRGAPAAPPERLSDDAEAVRSHAGGPAREGGQRAIPGGV